MEVSQIRYIRIIRIQTGKIFGILKHAGKGFFQSIVSPENLFRPHAFYSLAQKSIPNISLIKYIPQSTHLHSIKDWYLFLRTPKLASAPDKILSKCVFFLPFTLRKIRSQCSGLKTTAAVSLFDHKMTQPILKKKYSMKFWSNSTFRLVILWTKI